MLRKETDLVPKHLEELKAFRDVRVAARFEIVEDRAWLRNLLAANDPWIEIRWLDDEHLQLDLLTLRPSSPMPSEWEQKSRSSWGIPVAQTEALSEWIKTQWLQARDTTSKRLRM